MDQARMGIVQRRGQAEEQLRRERERLATRAWWRRPTSLSTSSWVRTGGARATTTPTHTAQAPTWPNIDASMVANAGDNANEEQVGEEEVRIVRLIDLSRDNLANEEIDEMEVDAEDEEENRQQTGARGKGRGKGRGGRGRDY